MKLTWECPVYCKSLYALSVDNCLLHIAIFHYIIRALDSDGQVQGIRI